MEWALGHSLEMTRIEKGIIKPGEKVSNESIVKALDQWLDYIRNQRTAGTYRTYASCANNLKKYLEGHPKLRRLDQFDLAEILRYRDWLLKGRGDGKPNQKKTADNNLIVLRAFVNYCVAMKKVRENPIHEHGAGVQVFFKEKKPRIETYTRAEYAKIVKHAPADLGRRCRFLAASGLRIDELAHLEYSDVDRDRGWLHVRTKITQDGVKWMPKDKTDRKLPLNDELRKVIGELSTGAGDDPKGYVFSGKPGPHRAKNLARSTLNELKDLSEAAGIPKSKLTSHNFRRYFVSQCADCGIDILCVMEWVGHDDWEMVRRYYRLRDEHAQDAMRRFTTGATAASTNAEGHATSPGAPARSLGGRMGEREDDRGAKGGRKRSQAPQAASLAACGAE
jgi:integrase